jgi:alpha-L-rhamnosidase
VSAPSDLRVEHLGDGVLGLGEPRPRISWRLPLGSRRQEAYDVEIDGLPCGWREAPDHVLVPWPGTTLDSRQRVRWRVRVRTDTLESPWSEPAWFELGLLHDRDWVATWIEPVEHKRSAHVLRRAFELWSPPSKVRLYATAHGLYECYLNGRRVGDLELTPGFTDYAAQLLVQAYDVIDLLVPGRNQWDVVLSDGWYRGRTGIRQRLDGYGTTLGFLGQLEADDVMVATDGDWRTATGSLVSADLMAGQIEDHRRQLQDLGPAAVSDAPLGPLAWSPSPPVRRTQEIRPQSVRRVGSDLQVVDLGQNINGWLRLTDLGPLNTELTIVHGESVDAAGDVTQEHLLTDRSESGGPFQVDHVTSAGEAGDVFEPRQTTHGFRFARIEGHPKRLTPDDISGQVVHSDFRRTGWFRCSDDAVNRFHDIADWSFRGNACDIPTDCPQRERAGWTGDWQLFFPAASFLYDVAGFSLKWLRDLAADQLPDGCITNVAPDPARHLEPWDDIWRLLAGSAGWGDAIVIVPWEMWRTYGDIEVLREFWPAMLRWLTYSEERARTLRYPGRAETRPEPLPHEQYLWDAGFHWGEWLEPNVGDIAAELSADQGAVATAYLHRSAALAAEIGDLLGQKAEAHRLRRLAHNALSAWRTEYIAADGTLSPETQANHVRALSFGLVPAALRAQTAERLVALVRGAGTHLSTGFLATPQLLPTLADAGCVELAYELLLQRTPPSWLAMIERGATTVWELWEGIDDIGQPHESLNHYSKGAVISFLHRYVAGIRLDAEVAAYRRFRVEPIPGGGLSWAEAVLDSPYGRIESSWRHENDRFELTVTVPPGAEAEVLLPKHQKVQRQGPGSCVYATYLAS